MATTILLAALGVAAFSLPPQCAIDPARPGQCVANTPAADAAQPRATASSTPAVAAAIPRTAAPSAAAQPEQQASSLISATFDQLPSAAAVGGSADSSGTSVASMTPAPTNAAANAPITRVVSTTVVRADPPLEASTDQPMSIFESPPTQSPADPAPTAAAPAATDPVPVAAPVAAAVAAIAPQPATQDPVEPASPPKRAAAATGSGTFVTSGGGVTVRSGPSGASAELFALAHGQKVTVTGKQNGWLQVVDSQGRRGWSYSRFFGTR